MTLPCTLCDGKGIVEESVVDVLIKRDIEVLIPDHDHKQLLDMLAEKITEPRPYWGAYFKLEAKEQQNET